MLVRGPLGIGSGGRIRTYDLWVMSQGTDVSRRVTGSHLNVLTSATPGGPSHRFYLVRRLCTLPWSQIWSQHWPATGRVSVSRRGGSVWHPVDLA
jgi:hypothetical protein